MIEWTHGRSLTYFAATTSRNATWHRARFGTAGGLLRYRNLLVRQAVQMKNKVSANSAIRSHRPWHRELDIPAGGNDNTKQLVLRGWWRLSPVLIILSSTFVAAAE